MAYTVDAGGAWVDRGGGKGPQHYNRGQGNGGYYVNIGGGSGGSAAVQQPSYDPMAAYVAMISAQEAAQRKAREEAYNRGVEQQRNNYNYAVGQVNDAANDALREAYINRMLTERNLQQQLTAQGLNGGASETTAASLYNNYGNARNELERERQQQIGSISNTYQNNLAQLEAQRASGEAASLSDYASQLSNLVASNIPASVNLTQADTTGNTSNLGYLEYLRRMAELMGQAG